MDRLNAFAVWLAIFGLCAVVYFASQYAAGRIWLIFAE